MNEQAPHRNRTIKSVSIRIDEANIWKIEDRCRSEQIGMSQTRGDHTTKQYRQTSYG